MVARVLPFVATVSERDENYLGARYATGPALNDDLVRLIRTRGRFVVAVVESANVARSDVVRRCGHGGDTEIGIGPIIRRRDCGRNKGPVAIQSAPIDRKSVVRRVDD